MVKCEYCGASLEEKDALLHKDGEGAKHVICKACFKKETGVDYETFAFRKENAKQTFFAVIFCLAATVYAFVEKGPMWGALGIALTILVYLFSSKAK